MGCGNSVLKGNNDAMPAKLIPFLHHPIDEINKRRRTNAMKEISPSKKELLVDGEANIDSFDHAPGGWKSVSEGLREFTERVDYHGAETDRRDAGKVPEKNEEAKEDEGMDLREDGITYPGSPSFRVYCLGDNNNNNNDNHSDHNDGDDNHDDGDHDCHDGDRIGADKTLSNDLEASADKDSEESMPKNGKKGRKIRNLKKAISIGKHTAAVKNIFNARSCYMSSSSSHRTHPGHA